MISLRRTHTLRSTRARAQRRTLTSQGASILYHAALLGICTIVLLPLLWMVASSLKDNNAIFAYPPQLLPAHPQWQNYADAMQYIDFWRYFGNTVFVTGLSVLGTVASCLLVAYSFARLQWRGRNVAFAVCMATLMLPYQATLIPLYITYRHLGWIGSYLPLIVPTYFGNPLYIFLLRQFLLTIPRELSEAASVDGANELRIFVRVIIPLTKPAVAAVALFSFLDSWQDFMGPLIYLNDQATYTLSLGLQLFFSKHSTAWAYLMCAAVIFTIPALVVFIAAQKTFVRGITLTGIKG